MTKCRALITGITGQDGSHLADLLLDKDYEVHGIARRCSRPVTERLAHIADRITLHDADMLDGGSLERVVREVQPDEVYNLAAMSYVGASWRQPILTAEITGLGALRLLEAVRGHAPEARYYQASSSEQFGSAPAPQNEDTPFHPRSPYGFAKCFAHHATVNYRESYGLHASCGILFNHEGPRRGLEFLTRKVTNAVAEIVEGKCDTLSLGTLSARRDWGYAPDYCEAMRLMLQQDTPGDYVIATGEAHSVREFVEMAFASAGLDWTDHVVIDPALVRPAEVTELRGDATRAHEVLGWRPQVNLEQLVAIMVQADVEALREPVAA